MKPLNMKSLGKFSRLVLLLAASQTLRAQSAPGAVDLARKESAR